MDPAIRLESLGRHLKQQHDQLLATQAPGLLRIREQLAGERVGRGRAPTHRRWYAAAGVLAAAATLPLLLARPEPVSRLECRIDNAKMPNPVGAWVAADARPVKLDFSDGTKTQLAPNSRARIVDLSSQGAHLVLESGQVALDVFPAQGAHWQVSTGPFLVEVTGTKFDVSWRPESDQFELTLREGQVRVSGCVFGTGRLVRPGETVRASCKQGVTEVLAEPLSAVPVEAAETEAPPVSLPALPVRRTAPAPGASSPTWSELARKGQYRAAMDALGPAFDAECERASAAELVSLGDVARFAGKPKLATSAYLALRRRFPGSSSAALGAFALARVSFDQEADYAAATRWLKTYLKEQPSGKFAREALGRLMEAQHRSGNAQAARATASTYLQRYSEGPHSQLARALTARQK